MVFWKTSCKRRGILEREGMGSETASLEDCVKRQNLGIPDASSTLRDVPVDDGVDLRTRVHHDMPGA